MYVNTNISALNTLNKLSANSHNSSKVMEGLASGKRINRASDDAAGSAVASRMTTQTRGLAQAQRNASDGIAALQTFESALASQGDIMQRMRELAVQSANGTYSDTDRTNLQSEFQQLSDEITRISTTTSFNGNKLISAASTIDLQLSDVQNDKLTVSIKQSDAATLKVDNGNAKIGTATDAQAAIKSIDDALDIVNSERANLGANMNRLEYTVENLGNAKVNLSDAKSRIEDLDMASAMSELSKNEVLTQSSMAMLGKANQAPQAILRLLQ